MPRLLRFCFEEIAFLMNVDQAGIDPFFMKVLRSGINCDQMQAGDMKKHPF